MLTILTRTARLFVAHWPMLLAWYLAGWLARYLLIELAGFVGATSALAGFLIMPLAILARLISFVAMFLVLREGMPGYQEALRAGLDVDGAIAAETGGTPGSPGRARRREFVDLTLASILPFFAFYAAWQFLADDTRQYAQVALQSIDYFDDSRVKTGTVLDLELNWLTGAIIVVAFVGRFLLKRYSPKLPKWTSLVSVYLEAVWVYLTLFLISTYLDGLRAWVDSRVALQWLEGLRGWLAETVAPLAWVWDAVSWAIAELGGLVLLPLAWLAIAAIVFGRSLGAEQRERAFRLRQLRIAQERFDKLPKRVSRRIRDVGDDLVSRWRPIGSALLLIWRAGAVPMGLFVLAYTALQAAEMWLLRLGVVVIGPHELGWWMATDAMLSFVVDVLIEPIRIALVVAAYDFALTRLNRRTAAAAATATAATATATATASAAGTSESHPPTPR